MNNQRIEISCLLILIFNVQSAYTLFARQETQKIRQLSSWIRKLTDYIFKQCDKLEVVSEALDSEL